MHRYKENKYPENTERLLIKNDSGLEAEVEFSFLHDTQASTYLLDPPTMTLKPDQEQVHRLLTPFSWNAVSAFQPPFRPARS